jgi:uroporphyrinogen decarboxylase
MNKRQWVFDAIDKKPINSIPGSFWFHFTDEYQAGQAAVDAYGRFVRESGVDFFKIMDETIFPFDVKRAQDWKSYRPVGRKDPLLQKQLDLVKLMTDTFGDEYYIPHSAFGPLRTLRMSASYSLILSHYFEQPELVLSGLKATADTIMEYVRDAIAAGADGIYYASKAEYSAGRDVLDKRLFDTLLALDLAICQAAEESSRYNILHICGGNVDVSRYLGFPCAVINFDVHENEISLKDGYEKFGKTVLGGLPNHHGPLVDGTDEEIAQAVRDTVKAFGHSEGLIFGADCTLPPDVDYHRLKVAMDTLKSLEI